MTSFPTERIHNVVLVGHAGVGKTTLAEKLAVLAGGITSTLFGAGGPPYAIYLSHRPLTKEQYRATLGICTIFSITLRVVDDQGAVLAPGIL